MATTQHDSGRKRYPADYGFHYYLDLPTGWTKERLTALRRKRLNTRARCHACPDIEWRDPPDWREGHPYVKGFSDLRVVIEDDDINQLLSSVYKDCPPATGIARFWYISKIKLLNVSKDVAKAFLESQTTHSVWSGLHHPNKSLSIMSTKAGARWECDVIYIKPTYMGFVGIFNLRDIYSKYLFSWKVKSEGAEDIVRCMDDWWNQLRTKFGVGYCDRVSQILCDQGPGFTSQAFKTWAEEHHIHLLYNKTATPTSRGFIEVANKEIARYVTSFAAERHTPWIMCVDDACQYINNTPNKGLPVGNTPNAVFRTDTSDPAIVARARLHAARRAVNIIYKNFLTPGDRVRLSIRTEMPHAFKGNTRRNRKGYLRNWTFEIYTIRKRRGRSYSLVGQPRKWFDRSDILHVPEDAKGVLKSLEGTNDAVEEEQEQQQREVIPLEREPSARARKETVRMTESRAQANGTRQA
jgi:hypothetical protein